MSLFPAEPQYPPGFRYIPGFISRDEEGMLLEKIKEIELHAFHFQGFEAKRKVASFGYDYIFEGGKLVKGKEIPAAFHSLIEKVASELKMEASKFAELLITEYPVGSVINWHRDAPPFDVIVGISLNANCVFKLRPYDKAKQGRRSIVSIPLQQRSLYVIDGVARTEWQHSTAPVKHVRYSITLRTLL